MAASVVEPEAPPPVDKADQGAGALAPTAIAPDTAISSDEHSGPNAENAETPAAGKEEPLPTLPVKSTGQDAAADESKPSKETPLEAVPLETPTETTIAS